MMNEIKDGSGQRQAGGKGQPHDHIADLADHMKWENAAEFIMSRRSQYTGDHR